MIRKMKNTRSVEFFIKLYGIPNSQTFQKITDKKQYTDKR